jgi:uncharacterized protein (TIGR03067 family)
VRYVTTLIVVSVASIGFCADQDQAPPKALNGRWAPETAVMAGKAFPDEVRKSIHLTLLNGKYTVKDGDQVDQGTYTVDESKTPKTITIVGTKGANQGKTILAIYEQDKTTLKVCYDMSGKAFPTKFESTEGSQLFLASYHREKGRAKGRVRAAGEALPPKSE